MKKTLPVLALVLIPFLSSEEAELKTVWPNGALAAVALTYDDTLDSHLDTAIPQLDKHGLVGTFYVSGGRGDLAGRMGEWRDASSKGHELGNHTLYHPCRRSKPGRDWVSPEYDLDGYTIDEFVSELDVTNTLLQAIDGKSERSFAYTCGDSLVGGEEIAEFIKPMFSSARATHGNGLNVPGEADHFSLSTYDGAEKTAEQMIAAVEAAVEKGDFVTVMFHGVGAEYLTVAAEEHAKFVEYLAENSDRFWVTTVHDAIVYLKSKE